MKFQKLIAGFLALAIAQTAAAIPLESGVIANENVSFGIGGGTTDDDDDNLLFTYVKLADGTYSIVSYTDKTSSTTDLTLPSYSANGIKVTQIRPEAFKGNTLLTSVTIPDTITVIGDNAFNGCTNLASVSIPDSVMTIGNDAFLNTAMINNQTGLKYADDWLVECDSITGSTLEIKDGTKGIANNAFPINMSVTTVTLPDGLLSIGESNFSSLFFMNSVNLPDSLVNIGDYAFSGSKISGNVTLPTTLKTIGKEAFKGCTGITSLTVQGNSLTIGSSAFKDCTGITSLTLSSGISSIGQYAFSGCSSVANAITIPGTVSSISDYAFSGCSVTSVNISSGVTSIGANAFEGCSAMTSVSIPDTVTSLGEKSFSSCTSLSSVTIPSSVTSIGNYSFLSCNALKSVNVNSGNANYSSIDGVLLNKAGTTIICYPASKTDLIYTVPDSVTTIGDYAFYNCTLNTLKMGVNVTGVAEGAFYCCYNLADVYYSGTESQWNAINIVSTNNNPFTSAEVHYNYGSTSLPPELSLQSHTDTSVTLFWTKVDGEDGYIIERQNGSNWSQVAKITDASTETYTVSGLSAATDYTFRICSYIGDVKSDYTTFTTSTHKYVVTTTAATCTTDGKTEKKCSVCDDTVTTTIPATGHSWGNTVYTWNDDKVCIASHTCTKDTSHTELISGMKSSQQSKAPTCTEMGETTYTAQFTVNWATTQTKVYTDIPATGHDWNTAVYSWSADGKSCTATHTCKTNSSHSETANATITSSASKAPTCTAKGTTTYTATFNVDWATTQTKTVTDIAEKHLEQ